VSDLREMPPEHAYRGPIDLEEMELEATLLAMKNGNNVRHKLQVLGREARNKDVGRTLTGNCWVRLDEYGNPEIIDEKKSYYDGAKFVAARFCVDGIRLASHETAAFARSGGLDRIINYMTDYSISKRSTPSATLVNIDYEEHGVMPSAHSSLWGWNGHKIDECPVCVGMKPMILQLEAAIERANKERTDLIESKTIYGCEPLEGEGFTPYYKMIFVPYAVDVERLAGPEPKTHTSYYGNSTDDMMTTINRHYEKIKTKRGSPKDVF